MNNKISQSNVNFHIRNSEINCSTQKFVTFVRLLYLHCVLDCIRNNTRKRPDCETGSFFHSSEVTVFPTILRVLMY